MSPHSWKAQKKEKRKIPLWMSKYFFYNCHLRLKKNILINSAHQQKFWFEMQSLNYKLLQLYCQLMSKKRCLKFPIKVFFSEPRKLSRLFLGKSGLWRNYQGILLQFEMTVKSHTQYRIFASLTFTDPFFIRPRSA